MVGLELPPNSNLNKEEFKVADTAVFEKKGRHLTDIQKKILEGAWQGYTYEEIADREGYSDKYLKRDVGPRLWKMLSEALGEKVTKKNFQTALQRRLDEIKPPVHERKIITNTFQDWDEVADGSVFYGRTKELVTLEEWIVGDCCRLVALLGMGGIGKTALSVKLAKRVQDKFEYVIWRSLRNAPSIEDILEDLIRFLSNQQETNSLENTDVRILRLLNYLRRHRCLMILDNAESILCSNDSAGQYRENYEGYGQLLRCIGETHHQSCLVLTSQEKPKEFTLLEGETLPVRSLQLPGLKEAEGQEIFRIKGSFSGLESEWKVLVEHYAGNPLALRIVAAAIQDLFNSSVSEFLEFLRQGTLVFDDIRALLDRQFNRLSGLEREVMYWLAIEREPVSLTQLRENILSSASRQRLPEALRSLGQRSLIDKSSKGFTQPPVIMEYVTEQLVERFYAAIVTEEVELLMSYTLVKPQAKDYIRESQVHNILGPTADRLRTTFSKKDLQHKLNQVLIKLRKKLSSPLGYGSGNVINLLCQLEIDLTGYDFSSLTVWQENLQNVNSHYVNFAHLDLTQSVFTKSFGSILSTAFSPDQQFSFESIPNVKSGKLGAEG